MAYQVAMQEEKLRKGPWLEEEDKQLIAIVALLGERRWDSIAQASGLRRSGKSCRLRWLNYLRPNLKRGPISNEEEHIILQLHERWGNKWSGIARRLPGRTDNEIKNYWRTHLRKKARVQEQGNFQNMISNAKDDFCNPGVDILGTTDDSFDVLRSSNFAIASSPYETRLSDWMSGLSDDQSQIKHHGDCCNSLDSCFCYPAWISEDDDDTSMWDCSGSLWNMD